MALFAEALPFVLLHEGGFSDDPADHGGRTNFGITQRALGAFRLEHPDLVLPADVADLTEDEAGVVYHADYWCFDGIESQRVATKAFDMAVNMGLRRAVKLLQTALNANGARLVVDGLYGGRTEAAVNAADEALLLRQLVSASAAYYRSIIERNPSQSRFAAGWLTRASALPPVVQ
jgi:lysozyme family protein